VISCITIECECLLSLSSFQRTRFEGMILQN
jgi:hypothetical protein